MKHLLEHFEHQPRQSIDIVRKVIEFVGRYIEYLVKIVEKYLTLELVCFVVYLFV